jgi:hypothetical protein
LARLVAAISPRVLKQGFFLNPSVVEGIGLELDR